jgi:hypothetical protein
MVKIEINGCCLMKAGYLTQAKSRELEVLLWFGSVVVALRVLGKRMKGGSYGGSYGVAQIRE